MCTIVRCKIIMQIIINNNDTPYREIVSSASYGITTCRVTRNRHVRPYNRYL